jgi:hypothetical protein
MHAYLFQKQQTIMLTLSMKRSKFSRDKNFVGWFTILCIFAGAAFGRNLLSPLREGALL